jgi:hypothetical protein
MYLRGLIYNEETSKKMKRNKIFSEEEKERSAEDSSNQLEGLHSGFKAFGKNLLSNLEVADILDPSTK